MPGEPNQAAVIANTHKIMANLNNAIAHTMAKDWPAVVEFFNTAAMQASDLAQQITELGGPPITVAPPGSEREFAKAWQQATDQVSPLQH